MTISPTDITYQKRAGEDIGFGRPSKRQDCPSHFDPFMVAIQHEQSAHNERIWQVVQKHSKMSYSECIELCRYIHIFSSTHYLETQLQHRPVYINSTHLPRAILFDQDGHVYLQLNKARLSDKILGEGSYKKVRLAVDFHKCEVLAVAVTTLLLPEEEEMCLKETKIIQDLQGQDSIANVYKLIRIEGKDKRKKMFSLQPYYPEGDLRSVIEKQILSDKHKCKIALDILKGFAALEANLIIHRDIKPDNIFISRNAQLEYQAHVGDFGLSCTTDEVANEKLDKGTAYYLSPEICCVVRQKNVRLQTVINHKLDAWAIGITLLELFTNKSLIMFNPSDDLHDQIAKIKPSDIPKRMTKIPVIDRLIRSLLNVDSTRRLTASVCLRLFETKIRTIVYS